MTVTGANGFYNPGVLQTSSVLLTNGLHDMAQPLTILAALLDEAGQLSEPALAGDHLAIARGECCRALAAFRRLQVLSTLDPSDEAEGVR